MYQNRIVNNSTLIQTWSSNWRADYHKYKGSSYVQVQKLVPRGSTVSNVTKTQPCNQRVKTNLAVKKGQSSPQKGTTHSSDTYKNQSRLILPIIVQITRV